MSKSFLLQSCSKSILYKAHINFLLYSTGDSFLFNINSTLPDLNKLLQRRPAAYTAYTASAALMRKPSNCQSDPVSSP